MADFISLFFPARAEVGHRFVFLTIAFCVEGRITPVKEQG
jgi:hypothetical protein